MSSSRQSALPTATDKRLIDQGDTALSPRGRPAEGVGESLVANSASVAHPLVEMRWA